MRPVVSYQFSTSNHNVVTDNIFFTFVVSYQISTSNHNLGSIKDRIPVTYSGIPLKKSSLSYRRSSLNVVFSNSDGQMYQKNSNCWGVSGLARSILPQKFKVSPYCLSVTLRCYVYPEGGIDLRTRLMQRLPGRRMQRLASRKSPLFKGGGANSGLMWSIRL